MGARERGQLSGDLTRGRSRFQAWRARRRGTRSRIPEPLWTLAVRLAKTHGVARAATVLGLDYYSLKKRVEAPAVEPLAGRPAFVELPAPVVARQCLFEVVNGAGPARRIQLVGYDAAEIAALARNFWGGE